VSGQDVEIGDLGDLALRERALIRDPQEGHVAGELTAPFGAEGEPPALLLLGEIALI
jgi:hypothetical protein